MEKLLLNIADNFDILGDISQIVPLGEGFINDTLIVSTKSDATPTYILQRKNKNVFKDVPAMMDNIVRVTDHIRKKVEMQGGDVIRDVMTVINTKSDKKPFFVDGDGEYWTMTLFIPQSSSYSSIKVPEIAYQGGVGIGKFQAMLSDFTDKLQDILPGFHNMRFRFDQWDEAIAKDIAGRVSSLTEEILWVESRRDEMMAFWSLIETGKIPVRVSHNDTKINNVLFDSTTNKALCMIDLDTVLSSTVLNDFGDAVRTYTNTGEEDDKDLGRVTMGIKEFRAFTEGYISEAKSFLTQVEIDNIAFSGRFIVFEQVLRFLMDYINGDTYYKIKYPDHNLVRTHAQYALLKSIESQYSEMVDIVKECQNRL